MKKKIFIIYIFIFISCSKKETEYYPNGNLFKSYELKNNKFNGIYKEFYQNGNIKIIQKYNEGILIDSSIYYNQNKQIIVIDKYLNNDYIYSKIFKNNVLEYEGRNYLNQKRGKWKYYSKNGKLKNIFEYIDFCREQYTNQGWVFNEQGELIKEKGNYYSLSIPKKNYNVNEVISLKITYKPFFINSNFFICLSPKIDKNFCNLNTTKLDTIYSNNKIFDINLTFSNKGNKNLRGFIREYYYKETDTINPIERFVYLDIPIKVE